MPHEDFDKDIEELAKEFRVTEAELLAIVALAALQQRVDQKLYVQINDRVVQLQRISGEWVARVVPGVYRSGMEEAIAAAKTGELKDLLRNPNHQQALNNLGATLNEDLAAATNYMGRDAKQALRNIASGNILDTLAGKKNILTGGESMQDQMLKRGVAFVDRSGRRWDPEAYARMALRTHTAIIMNTGHLNTAADIGSPGVRVRDGGKGDTDEPCRRANGQAWGLQYAMAHRIQHPNCRRAFAALTSDYEGPLDRGERPGGGGGGSGGGRSPGGGSGGGGLPNFDRAVISDEKLLYAIRDPSKGRVLKTLGFTEENIARLREEILSSVADAPATLGREDAYGARYRVIAPITGPNGKRAPLTTAWIYDAGQDFPRLITTYINTDEWRRWQRQGRL